MAADLLTPPDAIVNPWFTLPGHTSYRYGISRISFDKSGEFSWQRRAGEDHSREWLPDTGRSRKWLPFGGVKPRERGQSLGGVPAARNCSRESK